MADTFSIVVAVLLGVASARWSPHWVRSTLWTITTLAAFTGVLHAFGFLGELTAGFAPSVQSRALDAAVIGLALIMSNAVMWFEQD